MSGITRVGVMGCGLMGSVADSLCDEYKEPLYAAPPLLRRMTDAGLLGRKTGQGFHDYRERA